MRNIIIASCLLAASASALIYQRSMLAKTRFETNNLSHQSAALEKKIAGERANLTETEARRTAQQRELAAAAETLNLARASRVQVTEMPDPAHEGHWPLARPYFYLAKKHIPTLQFTAVTGLGGVSAEAAALFGMTPPERRAIDNGIERMFADLRKTELRAAYRTNTPPMVESQRKGEKISIHLPANSSRDELKAELAGNIADTLGSERAPFFLDRVREMQSQFDSFSPEDRVVTIIPKDEHSGEVITSAKWGMSFNYYDRSGDRDYIRFQYDHLLEAFLFGRK